MKRITILLTFLVTLGMYASFAQQKVSGVVTGADDGAPIPGVTVLAKGAENVGAVTNFEGKYTLTVPKEITTLVFSFMGMESQEAEISGRTEINVALKRSDIAIDDVVVTALGISREKKALGYAVQEVAGSELDRAKNENIINSISGKVSGVTVKTNTNFGGSSNILIRGTSSLTGDNQPLFVVDGVPVSNRNTNDYYQMRGRSGYDYGNPIADINPNDIESINVLKGAASTALYGSRAANGVIIITTKKGKQVPGAGKKVTVSVNHSTMWHKMDKSTFPEHQTEYGAGYGPYYSDSDIPQLLYYDFDGDGTDDYIEATTEDASQGAKFDPNLQVFNWESFYPESPNYMKKQPYVAGANGADYFMQTGRTITNNVDIAGGTNVSTFRLSLTNTDGTGIMPNSEMKKNNVQFNASYDVKDNIKISASAMYTNTYTKGRNHTGYSDNIMSMFRQWYNVGVDMKKQDDYYHSTGKNLSWNPHSEDDLSPIYWDNPYWARYENYQDDQRDRLLGYVQADWDITDNLSFMAKYSVDYFNFIQEERKAVGSVSGELGVDRPDVTSGYARNAISNIETNFDMMLKFNKNFSESFNLNAFIGSNIRRSTYERVYASTNSGLAVPEVFALSNSSQPMLPPDERHQEIGVNGFFGSVSLGIKNMLFVDFTERIDASSTLPEDNRVYSYPSVSTSFLFSEVVKSDLLNLGKIRLNYAKVGNDAPWGSVTDAYRIEAPFGSNTLVRFPTYKNNPELEPEISTSMEAGLELSMLDNRIGLDFALYKTNTVNQIVDLEVSRATGFQFKYYNIGEIENKGVELQLRGTPVKMNDLRWDITLNWSKNTNEVIKLGEDIENYQLASFQGGVSVNAREGEPLGTIHGTDFEYAPDGQKIITSRGYYDKTGKSDIVLGNINPDWHMGITNTLSYKGIIASFLIDIQKGGDVFSLDQWYGQATGLYPITVGNNELGNPKRDDIIQNEDGTYDPKTGGILLEGVQAVDNNDDGEIDEYVENTTRIKGNNYGAFGYATSPNARYIYDASYVKLRELSIGYMLPSSMLQNIFISSATISFVGSNLWIIHKNLPDADPEASQSSGNLQGWQSGVMPATRNFGFKVNLTF